MRGLKFSLLVECTVAFLVAAMPAESPAETNQCESLFNPFFLLSAQEIALEGPLAVFATPSFYEKPRIIVLNNLSSRRKSHLLNLGIIPHLRSNGVQIEVEAKFDLKKYLQDVSAVYSNPAPRRFNVQDPARRPKPEVRVLTLEDYFSNGVDGKTPWNVIQVERALKRFLVGKSTILLAEEIGADDMPMFIKNVRRQLDEMIKDDDKRHGLPNDAEAVTHRAISFWEF